MALVRGLRLAGSVQHKAGWTRGHDLVDAVVKRDAQVFILGFVECSRPKWLSMILRYTCVIALYSGWSSSLQAQDIFDTPSETEQYTPGWAKAVVVGQVGRVKAEYGDRRAVKTFFLTSFSNFVQDFLAFPKAP